MRFRLCVSVLVAALTSASGVTVDATVASPTTIPTLRWETTAAGGRFAWGSPAIGDVNNDGSNDVVSSEVAAWWRRSLAWWAGANGSDVDADGGSVSANRGRSTLRQATAGVDPW
jgi:hypothetical protein